MSQQISNFFLHRFFPENYSDFCFCFSSSSRSRAMCSSRHNISKILSNRNKILQTCSGVNIHSCKKHFLGSFSLGVLELGDLKVKKYFEIFPMLFQAEFQTSRFSQRYISTEWTDFDAQ